MDYFTSDRFIKPKKGDLLISEPYLPDPNFERTVIFLCEHDENGSFGFVLNKKANVKLGEVIEEVNNSKTELLIGGPVQKDTLHYLHRDSTLSGFKEVSSGIYWGGDFDQVLSLINTKKLREEDFRFFIGYSGWGPNQLIDELKAKSWIVFSGASPEMVFDWDNQDLWKACLKAKGGKFKLISNYPVDPRLN